ncbi:MAG TPA: type II toxin-antitoxin system PemK/MazF family toxin [Vicinamibacterales bacterium]|nr:type II toxin-antitoxin system PemK/MazF family toxin [Vicinamibacterales bacterium]
MKRGDIVIVATRGAYTSKPRPALVLQSDVYNDTHASVTICLLTSDCVDASRFRVAVPPGSRTGLREPSQVMVDKIFSIPRGSIGPPVGSCNAEELTAVGDALRDWLEL